MQVVSEERSPKVQKQLEILMILNTTVQLTDTVKYSMSSMKTAVQDKANNKSGALKMSGQSIAYPEQGTKSVLIKWSLY